MAIKILQSKVDDLLAAQDKQHAFIELQANCTEETASSAFILSPHDTKEYLCAHITEQRLLRQNNGFTHSDGNSYPINLEAQTAYMGQINAAQLGLPVQCFAHSMDNKEISFTLEGMIELVVGVMLAVETINKQAWQAKKEIRQVDTFALLWNTYTQYMNQGVNT